MKHCCKYTDAEILTPETSDVLFAPSFDIYVLMIVSLQIQKAHVSKVKLYSETISFSYREICRNVCMCGLKYFISFKEVFFFLKCYAPEVMIMCLFQLQMHIPVYYSAQFSLDSA